jgi:hypothetical protein
MTRKRTYQGIEISQRQGKLIDFIQKGNNRFWDAFTQIKKRNTKIKSIRFFASWFNRTLKQLQNKNLFMEIPYVYILIDGNFIWENPGVKGSKSNFQALTLHDGQMEIKSQINKIL